MAQVNTLSAADMIVIALGAAGTKGLDPEGIKTATGLRKDDAKLALRDLTGEQLIVIKGGRGYLTDMGLERFEEFNPAPAPAAKPSKPSKPGKSSKVDLVEEVEEEVELSQEDLDAMIDEYNALYDKKRKTTADKTRFEELEAILDENGAFEEAEDEAEDEDAAVPAEDEFEFDEDPGEEPEEDEVIVPAAKPSRTKAATAAAKPAAVPEPEAAAVPVEAHEAFSLGFKPIDTLSDKELTDRIDKSIEAAESLLDSGHGEVAEMLMRSVAKARKQLKRRG